MCETSLNYNTVHLGDDEGEEKLALASLCALMLKKGSPAPLVYIFEQCQVRISAYYSSPFILKSMSYLHNTPLRLIKNL